MITIRDVLGALEARGLVSVETSAGVRSFLADASTSPAAPWYLNAALGAAAWIAGLFLMAFLFEAKVVAWENDSANIVVGLALIGAALGVRRAASALFLVHLALVLSVAGHLLVVVGIADHSIGRAALALVALAAVLYIPYRDPVHRFLSVTAALILLLTWIGDRDASWGLHILVLVQGVGVGWLLGTIRLPNAAGREGRIPAVSVLPAAYAQAVMLLVTLLVLQDRTAAFNAPSTVIATIGLIAACAWATTGRAPLWPPHLQAPLLWGSLLLGLLTTPGLPATLALLILGFGRQDRVLVALGLGFLPAFLTLYYYNLEIDLATKSWVLMGSGVVLLGVRHWLLGAARLAPRRDREAST